MDGVSMNHRQGFVPPQLVHKMNSLGRFLVNEFIYGCHFLSLSGSAIVLSAMFFMNVPIRWEFCIIAYFLTQTAYTYNHYREFKKDSSVDSKRVRHLRRYGCFFPFLVFSYGLSYSVALISSGSSLSIVFGFVFLGIGLIYTEVIKSLTQRIIGLKSFYTSFSLALLVMFTAVYCGHALDVSVIVFSLFLFLNMSINTTFYDLKDMETDKKDGLKTLPLVLGKYRFLKLLHVLNIIAILPVVFGVWYGALPLYALLLIGMFGYCFYFIQKAWNSHTDLDFLSYIVVDGQYYLLPMLLFIGTMTFTT